MTRRADAETLHDLVHADAESAWPRVCEFIEASDPVEDYWAAVLLEDVIYSDKLGVIIDELEHQARASVNLRRALVRARYAVGGAAGPHVDRLMSLIDEFEPEFFITDVPAIRIERDG